MTKPRTYTDYVSIELTCHKGYGAELQIEVEFSCSPFVPAVLYGDHPQPEEGGEREIVSVNPFKTKEIAGRDGEPCGFTKREYLDTPAWLTKLLIECIDVGELCVKNHEE